MAEQFQFKTVPSTAWRSRQNTAPKRQCQPSRGNHFMKTKLLILSCLWLAFSALATPPCITNVTFTVAALPVTNGNIQVTIFLPGAFLLGTFTSGSHPISAPSGQSDTNRCAGVNTDYTQLRVKIEGDVCNPPQSWWVGTLNWYKEGAAYSRKVFLPQGVTTTWINVFSLGTACTNSTVTYCAVPSEFTRTCDDETQE